MCDSTSAPFYESEDSMESDQLDEFGDPTTQISDISPSGE